jgi:hypothetical protein
MSAEKWKDFAEEARQLSEIHRSLSSYKADTDLNLQDFISSQEPTRSASEASIVQRAAAHQNSKLAALREQARADRRALIRSDITSLEELQERRA